MNKRIIFWIGFVIVLALIIWGLIAAMNKQPAENGGLGSPAPVTASDHIVGSSTAPVTMIEYSDFQCPACETYYFVIQKLLDEASTSVRLVYRHFPLPQHANAMAAAEASEAAGLQGKFAEMYDKLFGNHSEWTEEKDPTPFFKKYAQEIGLDMAKYDADTHGTEVIKKVMDMQSEGQQIGINSTPTFFVNGKVIKNPASYDEFKSIIEEAAKSAN